MALNDEQVIAVKIEAPADPLVSRTFTILTDRVQQRCPARVVEAEAGAEPRVVLAVDGNLPTEAFRIDEARRRCTCRRRVAAGSALRRREVPRGPAATTGRSSLRPGGALRRRTARCAACTSPLISTTGTTWPPEAEITRYMEDLALWGVNAIMVIFPMINLQDWDDPQAEPAMDMVRQYARTARDLGLQFATGINNTMFSGAPADHPGDAPARPHRPAGQQRASRLPEQPGRACVHHGECPPALRAVVRCRPGSPVSTGRTTRADAPASSASPGAATVTCKLSRDLTQLGREYFPRSEDRPVAPGCSTRRPKASGRD